MPVIASNSLQGPGFFSRRKYITCCFWIILRLTQISYYTKSSEAPYRKAEPEEETNLRSCLFMGCLFRGIHHSFFAFLLQLDLDCGVATGGTFAQVAGGDLTEPESSSSFVNFIFGPNLSLMSGQFAQTSRI